MRYFRVSGGKIHLTKEDGKQTLCGHDIKKLWAHEIEPSKWSRFDLCKKCEEISHKIMEKGKQLALR